MARFYGRDVSLEDLHTWDLGVSLGLAEHEVQPFMDRVHAPETLGAMALIDGAREALHRIGALGFEVHIVTGRPPSTAATTRDWLRARKVPHDVLIHVDKYGHNVASSAECRVLALGDLAHKAYAFAVEDSGETAVYLAGKGVPVALMDRPWNRGVEVRAAEERKLISRYSDWSGVLCWIEEEVHAGI